MQHGIEVVNGVFKGIFSEMADLYKENINGMLYEYMTPKDREFICAHFPVMENIFPLYALYAAVEKTQDKVVLEMLVWVTKDMLTQGITFFVNPSFDRDERVRELLSQAIEKVDKYLPNKVVFGRLE
ncbi:MAG: hypothetical protein UR60_C0019G0016 [Candidatus Moranbacteria bacterium GW2011_GWF2_34_56]|nr:MAG: hypothetical protein UR51_C0006G0023 [Candidatus Moranbacteria bacterium GW2011_GWF1_34_10]KKP64561.1 MAG: hypothetical protein UR60_C0019G0016 [Candidatus Moranbacteria bacterium GW2011_GWF2_34_56]HBI16666.1 hypothetical protein [Candidatus Moranbacteria bacterium]